MSSVGTGMLFFNIKLSRLERELPSAWSFYTREESPAESCTVMTAGLELTQGWADHLACNTSTVSSSFEL